MIKSFKGENNDYKKLHNDYIYQPNDVALWFFIGLHQHHTGHLPVCVCVVLVNIFLLGTFLFFCKLVYIPDITSKNIVFCWQTSKYCSEFAHHIYVYCTTSLVIGKLYSDLFPTKWVQKKEIIYKSFYLLQFEQACHKSVAMCILLFVMYDVFFCDLHLRMHLQGYTWFLVPPSGSWYKLPGTSFNGVIQKSILLLQSSCSLFSYKHTPVRGV